jgi:hypothetical protein
MAVVGAHYKKFNEDEWDNIEERFPTSVSHYKQIFDEAHHKHYKIRVSENGIRLDRVVIISEVDFDDMIHVTMEEASVHPVSNDTHIVMHREEFKIHANVLDEVEFRFRHIRYFLIQTINPKTIPPFDLITKAEKITKDWLGRSSTKVVLFLDKGDVGDQWCYQITTTGRAKKIIVSHLDPATADGPLYSKLVNVWLDGLRQGRLQGVVEVGEKMAMTTFREAFTAGQILQGEIPDSVREFLRNGFIDQLKN